MPNRRMFSNRIANSARFLQMPAESQLLYFHLILRADDDGIVEAYPLIKLLGLAPDNFKVLLAKNFIKQLNEDQVIVITDWQEHNLIRADRKVNSIYLPLLQEKYPELPIKEPKPRIDVEDNSLRLGGQSTDGIGKVRLGKVRLGKDKTIAEINSAPVLKKKIDETPMSLQEFMEWCKKSPQRHIQIIGEWAEAVETNYTIKSQWDSFIRRNLRPAKNLIAFTDEQLQEAFNRLQKDIVKINSNTGKKVGFITKYTLETLGKYI